MPVAIDTLPRRPISVLVVIYTADAQVLLLKRRRPFDFWQSVTGSLHPNEHHAAAASRELYEETGLAADERLVFEGISRVFVIDPRWRHRYAPGIVENVEFEWRFRLDSPCEIRLDAEEHEACDWVPIDSAIDRVWSWTNREALQNIALTLG